MVWGGGGAAHHQSKRELTAANCSCSLLVSSVSCVVRGHISRLKCAQTGNSEQGGSAGVYTARTGALDGWRYLVSMPTSADITQYKLKTVIKSHSVDNCSFEYFKVKFLDIAPFSHYCRW